MIKVNKESLARRIKQLEGWKEHGREASLNEEYQLEAYRMLLSFIVGAVAADDMVKRK